MAALSDDDSRQTGLDAGQRAADAILAARQADGADHAVPLLGEDHLTSEDPGRWRLDPVGRIPHAVGAYWNEVTPITMTGTAQFRAPPPPAMDSPAYTPAYEQVRRLGGDGEVTATERTPAQTEIGVFWSYDGTPGLCTPPRMMNQILRRIAQTQQTGAVELARLLALVNTALADTAMAVWESKYHYDLWRPVTGIREADKGTGPAGAGDGNPDTVGDPDFTPLGAQASNTTSPNFSPPFPAYPSGHAGFGGALFQALRHVYGTDRIAFTFVSDEYNAVTRNNRGFERPTVE